MPVGRNRLEGKAWRDGTACAPSTSLKRKDTLLWERTYMGTLCLHCTRLQHTTPLCPHCHHSSHLHTHCHHTSGTPCLLRCTIRAHHTTRPPHTYKAAVSPGSRLQPLLPPPQPPAPPATTAAARVCIAAVVWRARAPPGYKRPTLLPCLGGVHLH